MKIRSAIAAGTIAVAALTAGVGIGSASASSATLTTTNKSEVLVTPRCYHLHQVTKTYFQWSTKLGRYVAYTSPHQTVTDYTTCHS